MKKNIDWYLLAKNLMFELDEQQIEKLNQEFDIIAEQMKIVQEINTDGIIPMDYPFYSACNMLREDNITTSLTQEEILKNAPESEEGFITINQVVK